jgi:hypothetical protein
MKKLLFVIVQIFITTNLFSQDSLVTRNVIAWVPTSLLNRTISLSYYRTIQQKLEATLKISVRRGNIKEPDEPHNQIFNDTYPVKDPYWYYSNFSTQVGFMRRFNSLFIEPVLNYEYGYFANQTLAVAQDQDNASIECWRLDRNYQAMGCVFYAGLCFGKQDVRVKLYEGVAYNFRFYQDRIYEKWIGDKSNIFYTNTDNTITKYTRHHVALKFGVELGFFF